MLESTDEELSRGNLNCGCDTLGQCRRGAFNATRIGTETPFWPRSRQKIKRNGATPRSAQGAAASTAARCLGDGMPPANTDGARRRGYRLELLVERRPTASAALRDEAKAAFRASWQRPQSEGEADVMELDCAD
jgi:hypothetical protein